MTQNELFLRIKKVIKAGWHDIPNKIGYLGTGAPGNYLEELLGIKVNNKDTPDSDGWEVKFSSGSALLTLCHKDPKPKGIINQLVKECGWKDEKGRISFRHTIAGKTERGFIVFSLTGYIGES